MRGFSFLSSIPLLAALLASCTDPVHSDRVDVLGPEPNGEPPGPDHRPGQPCLVCHGGEGPADAVFSFAGTVYARASGTEAAPKDTQVVLTTADERSYTALTNEAGNFYVAKSKWDVPFPIKVKIMSPSGVQRLMLSRLGQDGGCATCHQGGGNNSHVPRVNLGLP